MDLASFSSSLIRLIQVHGPWIISVVVALESAGVPLPGETILVAAALLAAATNQIDIAVVVAAAAAGAIIGDGIRIHGRAALRNAASSQIRAIHSSE
jgi:membrane protein DedA with SNARE-associated domain